MILETIVQLIMNLEHVQIFNFMGLPQAFGLAARMHFETDRPN